MPQAGLGRARSARRSQRVNDAAKPLVAVDLKAPAGKPVARLRRRADAGLGAAHPEARAGRARRPRSISASSSTACRPASMPKGPFELTFTVVDGERAIEVTTRLD